MRHRFRQRDALPGWPQRLDLHQKVRRQRGALSDPVGDDLLLSFAADRLRRARPEGQHARRFDNIALARSDGNKHAMRCRGADQRRAIGQNQRNARVPRMGGPRNDRGPVLPGLPMRCAATLRGDGVVSLREQIRTPAPFVVWARSVAVRSAGA